MLASQFPSLADFSPEELILMADEHDDLAFGAMLENHPEMKVADGLYRFLTGLKNPYANMVFGLRVPDAQGLIAEITTWVNSKQVPSFWWVGPRTEPLNIDEMLVASGWKEGKPAPAMVVELDKLSEDNGPDGLVLREVKNEEDLHAWQELFALGYELPVAIGRLVRPKLGGSMQLFAALLDGKPVGTTGVFTHRGVPGIYCVSTVPEYRGRGIGGAITALPLIKAREHGYRLGTLQASTMGYPVYKRLGFTDVCTIRMFSLNV